MLYAFNIRYFEEQHQGYIEVPIIMDLPQANLADVKMNPFVIDIINYPFMKAGIQNMPGHSAVLVDNIYEYPYPIPNHPYEITCKYQKNPGNGAFYNFNFKINAIVPAGYYLPHDHLEFTCHYDYDAYEELFYQLRFIKAPIILPSNPLVQNGFYYQLKMPVAIDAIKIIDAHDTNNIIAESIDLLGNVSSLNLTPSNSAQVCSIRLRDEFLRKLGFALRANSNLYGQVDINYFEGSLVGNNGVDIPIYLRKDDRVGYSFLKIDRARNVVIDTIKCFWMEELQEILFHEYHEKIDLSNQQLADLAVYLTNVNYCSNIISRLPYLLQAFFAQRGQVQPSHNDVISFVSSQFQITPNEAEHYLHILHQNI